MANIVEILIRGRDEASDVLKGTLKNLHDFSAQTTLLLGGVTALAGGMLALAKATANYADAIDEAREKTGIGAETLSGWKYAAEQSDTTFESLTGTLKALSQTIF